MVAMVTNKKGLICAENVASNSIIIDQGRRHEVLIGRGTDSAQTSLPQNLDSPRISATWFWKYLKMQSCNTYQEKRQLNIQISRGTSPRWFVGGAGA